jgi:predicted GH43/DUF377 family glycosyl hydrolase
MRIREQRKQLVQRRSTVLNAESSRVITRPHIPGDSARITDLMDRVSKLNDEDVKHLLEAIFQDFSGRHRNFRETLQRNYERIAEHAGKITSLSTEQELLLGAYFTAEYSVEAAAFFNPSIVLHPDQKGSGLVDDNHDIYFDPISQYVATPEMHTDPVYHRLHFRRKLEEMGASDRVTNKLLKGLGETFSFGQLETKIRKLRSTKFRLKDKHHAIDTVLWLARSNYEVIFRPDVQISERVIFPVSENESSGIEDARFVRFENDDKSVIYYATYTAYNGFSILPQILETTDFLTFRMHTISGKAAQNKGMALFPRKVDGKFVMLSRQDGVNNYIMFSDSVRHWEEAQLLQEPVHPLEFVQIGNCGSPVETPEGWLALFHGVGPMRRYSIWAELLDLDDPSQVIGRLDEPILTPDEHERDGYVPNVVYTCGSMIHGDSLIIPYGIADQRSRVATVSVPELLSRLRAT